MIYNISTSDGWVEGKEFILTCSSSSLNAPARMLLLSDGSLTRLLNALLLSPITLNRLRQGEVELDNEMADYIQAEAGQMVIDRDVWLMNNSEKLVYAHSILPTSLMRDDIYNEIARGETPIGTVLNDQSILTRRDRLQFTRVTSSEVARELDLPNDAKFWARRYRLNTEGGFKGAIMEVFSPKLFEVV